MTDGRSDFRRDIFLIPNLISLFRVVGVMVAAGLLFADYLAAALILGLATGFTDYLDGYLARKLNQATPLGALLDSLADILAALVCMTVAVYYRIWPPYIMIFWGVRDMGVLAMRNSAAQQGISIPTSMLGKVAMNFTGFSYLFLAVDVVKPAPDVAWLTDGSHWAGYWGIHLGIALQWLAATTYVRSFAKGYRRDAKQSG